MTDTQPLRILLVDDEISFLMAVAAALQERGFTVETCESGEEAIELLQRESFAVILLDYRLPGISGINVLQWMHEQKMETPVVMMTGAGSEVVAVEAMSLGAYDYLPKELIEIDHLPITINSANERYLFRKEREARSADDRCQQRTVETATMMRSTLNSLAHILNNNLTLLSLNVQDSMETVLPRVADQDRGEMERHLDELREGIGLVTSGVHSMLALSESVYQRLVGSVDLSKADQEVKAQIAALERAHHRSMNEQSDHGSRSDTVRVERLSEENEQ
jgi:DNA-binding response OmpR family regulator